MPYDNVIIFGAGASFDAGIPLLNKFVDTMWSYGVRGKSPHGQISEEDKKLFAEAHDIRVDLERYNSRANFNSRNLEDVLSLLSFESLAGGEPLKRYQTWVKAITRTIELSSKHQINEDTQIDPRTNKKTIYHSFWRAILHADYRKFIPALITFNYDLVLEKTLLDCFYNIYQNNVRPTTPTCKIEYFFENESFVILPEDCQHTLSVQEQQQTFTKNFSGSRPKVYRQVHTNIDIKIPYLKLHGSLNWDSRKISSTNAGGQNKNALGLLSQTAQHPLILPPVFNKMNSGDVMPVWKKALEILREAKNIIIVGYSLPKTDIYMQYFLKSAVGPNDNLQWIKVFDPALFRNNPFTAEMKARYQDCFSPQFKDRIEFNPKLPPGIGELGGGTFSHFVETLISDPRELLFT
jgi:hypothetical protein